ncbi:MAG: APC family permease [Propionibacteriaceae bacterium]
MSFSAALKRVIVGRKLSSDQLGDTLLPKRIALPVFASDALSSVAYAPDEIILTLSLAGAAGFAWDWRIGLMVGLVMLVVVMSYRQTVHAYPSGGGDYEVATENLGANAGLTVASALLVDYVLTVAVSVSSGIQNAKALSVFSFINGHEGLAAATIILIIMAINLRGVRESGTVFAIPTYLFMLGILGMTGYGLWRIMINGEHLRSPMADYQVMPDPSHGVPVFAGFAMVALLARTFSSGCAALTGVEAISNGVPAFKEPKSRNAATTLSLLGGIAVSMLMGIIVLGHAIGARMIDSDHGGSHFVDAAGNTVKVPPMTVVGQLANTVFSDFKPGIYYIVLTTFIILFLAANTAFNGFPVLASILARDGYLPHMLHTRGDRLAYSNGIVALAAGAVALVVAFNASVTALIQLYVVGVFVSFTVSQAGMMIHWTRALRDLTEPKERSRAIRSRIINGIGLAMTGIVLIVVLLSKFLHGAWIAILAMAIIFVLMRLVKRHYTMVAKEVALSADDRRVLPSRFHAIVMVSAVNKPTARAVSFARGCRPNTLEAVTVAADPEATQELLADWNQADLGLPLTVLASPYREVVGPFVEHVKSLRSANPRDVVCIFVPEFVVGHWWEQILHNQTALYVRARLHFTPNVMVASVPYLLRSSHHAEERLERDHPAAWRLHRDGGSAADLVSAED